MNLKPSLLAAAAIAAIAASPAPALAAFNTLNGQAPIVIGHRGASGYLPEHTLQGYALAIQQGANFIEPDLVMTKDGVLIARHEPLLGGTTDVSTRPEFASRKSTKMLDGVSTADWYASDFTLAEIKTLRAIQPRANRPQQFNGLYEIPTLDEVIALTQSESARLGRKVGIYPEVKHGTFHDNVFGAKVFENKLVDTLHAAYGNSGNAPVFIQSFEVGNLQYMNTRTNIRLVQLVDANDVNPDGSLDLTAPYGQPYDVAEAGGRLSFADMLTGVGLNFVKTYADGVGPWKPYLVKTTDPADDNSTPINDRLVEGSTGVIEAAHAAGLLVHAYTFRNDASGYGFADPQAEMTYYFQLGVDGVFTDFPDTGVAALAAVPEPQTYALMLLGLAVLVGAARKRR
ncbi:MAG: glycerophosphodiester phosphodiesterase family protein [Rubrivivax sp.]